jgi:ribosomal protein L29
MSKNKENFTALEADQLQARLFDIEEEYRMAREAVGAGKEKNVRRLRVLRRTVARAKTALHSLGQAG